MNQKLTTPRVETALLPSLDPLADPLRLLNLTGVLHCRAELSAPWGLDIPRIANCIAVHVVTRGQCWLDIAGQPSRRVLAGSLVIVPHGSAHQLRSSPEAKVTALNEIPIRQITDRYEHMQFGGGGSLTTISYCGIRFDPIGADRLLRVLPLVLQVDTDAGEDTWLRDTVRFIAQEADSTRPGSEKIITSLADILLVQGIRAWLDSSEEQGWLAALRDRYIGQALAEIHRSPGSQWTVESLARQVGLSRSAFSERFTRLVGQTVMQYLTEWRMQVARTRLINTTQPILDIAEALGYQSDAAFSRAFKRVFNMPPGKIRRGQDQAGSE